MASFQRVVGKKIEPLEDNWFDQYKDTAEKLLIDIGTGDGRFILDAAREHPEWLCIGIDAAAENMQKNAGKASAKPKKGGLPNVLFLRGAAENLPGPFAGKADMVTVNYPWGSLMRIVSEPDLDNMKKIRDLCKPGAELTVFLNYYVFEDREYMERLGFSDIAKPAENEDLPEIYKQAGFQINKSEIFAGDPPFRTMWGRHLVRGSNRTTLLIEAEAI